MAVRESFVLCGRGMGSRPPAIPAVVEPNNRAAPLPSHPVSQRSASPSWVWPGPYSVPWRMLSIAALMASSSVREVSLNHMSVLYSRSAVTSAAVSFNACTFSSHVKVSLPVGEQRPSTRPIA